MATVIPPFANRPTIWYLEVDKIIIDTIKTELRQVIREEVRRALELESSDREIITRSQAAKLLDISLPTLRDWTVRAKLNAYRMGSRVYYKRSEVLDALDEIITSPS